MPSITPVKLILTLMYRLNNENKSNIKLSDIQVNQFTNQYTDLDREEAFVGVDRNRYKDHKRVNRFSS